MSTAEKPRRADARRNREAIVQAAIACFARRPEASVAEIAEAAGVGRVTLYGHFPTRAALVEEAMRTAIDEGERTLAPLDLNGDPRQALATLIDASWRAVDRARGVLAAAQRELGTAQIRQLHERPAARAQELIERGRREGGFRDDLELSWLVATMHHVMHGAADEVAAGRLAAEDAAGHITAVVLGALSPPVRRAVPASGPTPSGDEPTSAPVGRA